MLVANPNLAALPARSSRCLVQVKRLTAALAVRSALGRNRFATHDAEGSRLRKRREALLPHTAIVTQRAFDQRFYAQLIDLPSFIVVPREMPNPGIAGNGGTATWGELRFGRIGDFRRRTRQLTP